jgi:hypothetical protein
MDYFLRSLVVWNVLPVTEVTEMYEIVSLIADYSSDGK